MKNLYFLTLVLLLAFQVNSQEETSSDTRPSRYGVTLIQENAFGFYPVIYGNIGLSKLDFTYYGVFWTNPSFGFPQTTFSSDLWLENGFGIGFNAFNGNMYINPALGFTHGKFLSGGDESVAFEGIVPSLSLYMNPGKMDTEIYLSRYQHLRDEVKDPVNRSTADFLFYWITPGFWVHDKISVGVHYEALYLKFGESDFESSYQWLGPYIKFRIQDKYDFRFMAGPNLKEGVYANEFYKLSTNIVLN